MGEASLPTEIPLLEVSQDILKDTVKALSRKGPVCVSPPFSITLELAKEAMWWVGFSLFFLPCLAALFLPWSRSLCSPSSFAGYR